MPHEVRCLASVDPTIAHCGWLSAPQGGYSRLGRPGAGLLPPRSPTACGSLPPEGTKLAWGGPAAGSGDIIEAQICAQQYAAEDFKEGETLVLTPRKARVFVA